MTVLNAREIGDVDASAVGEFVLRQALRLAQAPHINETTRKASPAALSAELQAQETSSPSLSEIAAHLRHADLKRLSELEHALDAGITLATLDQANVVAVEISAPRQFLLTDTTLLPPMA